MHKDKYNIHHYETSRLIVDFYHPQDNGNFICSCYTPGVPASIEPEYLVKVVTYQELKDKIADSNGNVNVCFTPDMEDYISFDKYFSGLNSYHIEAYCTDVINKREFRNHLFDPAIYHKINAAA